MRLLLKFSTLPVLALALCASVANADEQSRLSVTCGDQNSTTGLSTDGHCKEGMITFRGSDFPVAVDVQVLSYPAGDLIDSATYATNEGQLQFTQTLVPYGSYMVVVAADNNGVTGDVITTLPVNVDSL